MPRSNNGGIFAGADFAADADFVTINTVIGHSTGNFGEAPSTAQNLDRLMLAVQTLVNVKSVVVSSAVVDLSVAGNRTIYGLGSNFNQAATTIFTIKFATEQAKYLTAAFLQAALQGVTLPLATASVPGAGGNITAYEFASATTKNIVVNVADFQ